MNIWLYKLQFTSEIKKDFLILALFYISYQQYYKLSLIISWTFIQSLMIIQWFLIDLLYMTVTLLQNWTFSNFAEAWLSFIYFNTDIFKTKTFFQFSRNHTKLNKKEP